MGACGGKLEEAEPKDDGLSPEEKEKLDEAAQRHAEIVKILLLGGGETGKSTFFKQVSRILDTDSEKNFDKEYDADYFRSAIFDSCLRAMSTLAVTSVELSGEFETKCGNEEARLVVLKTADSAKDGATEASFTALDSMLALWKDPGIQKTFELRSKFWIPDNVDYFMEKLPEIVKPEWKPTFEDALRHRVRTTGAIEKRFKVKTALNETEFLLVDVGGQRGERKKWARCFSDVQVVLFMSAISAYDEMLFEDASVNRVREDLSIFEEIMSLEYFKKSTIILFLNKSDLFEKKFPKVPVKDYFPTFEGTTVDDGFKFFTDEFKSKKPSGSSKQIYVHITCVLDTNQVERVFKSVKADILKKLTEMDFS